jgi:hypothetical protein
MTPTREMTKILKTSRSPEVIKTPLDFLRTRLSILPLAFAFFGERFAKPVRFEGDVH